MSSEEEFVDPSQPMTLDDAMLLGTRLHLIVCADTLCYFGDLEPVTRGAQRALHPNGWLVFTVEALEEGSFALQPIGRYSHSQAYVRDALARAAFTVTTLEPAVLRTERSQPVHGYLVAARR